MLSTVTASATGFGILTDPLSFHDDGDDEQIYFNVPRQRGLLGTPPWSGAKVNLVGVSQVAPLY